jgi:HEAT repeat protein
MAPTAVAARVVAMVAMVGVCAVGLGVVLQRELDPATTLRRDLDSSDEVVRWEAARELGDFDSPRGLEALLIAARDPATSVRAVAPASLGTMLQQRLIQNAPAEDSQRLLSALESLLKDRSAEVRSAAALAASTSLASTVDRLEGKLLRDPGLNARASVILGASPTFARAVDRLERIGSDRRFARLDLRPLVSALGNGLLAEEPIVCRARLFALEQIGQRFPVDPPPELAKALQVASIETRVAAIQTAAKFQQGVDGIVPLLFRSLEDPELFARTQATSALGEIRPDAGVIPYLEGLMTSSDSETSLLAAAIFPRIGSGGGAAVPVLIELLKS